MRKPTLFLMRSALCSAMDYNGCLKVEILRFEQPGCVSVTDSFPLMLFFTLEFYFYILGFHTTIWYDSIMTAENLLPLPILQPYYKYDMKIFCSVSSHFFLDFYNINISS